jgi:predicted ATPase/serine/threonine protein kinase
MGPTLLPGTKLSRYEIRSLLGAGGMGEVYLALDTALGRRVALKVLPAAFAADEARLARFEREARTASSLNHPNIITIHEIGHSDEVYFIVTEYIVGETLRHKLKQGRLILVQALDVACQVADALATAHEAGIIHRDIKPENLMLRGDGFIKVLDFGLAKLTQPAESSDDAETMLIPAAKDSPLRTEPGHILGTPHYMSPEQARGLFLDARTDIFSLGVVLYEMVTGVKPFKGNTVVDIIAAILHFEPVAPSRLSKEISPQLDLISNRALAKELKNRYQTISDLAADLRQVREELLFQARERSEGSRSGKLTHAFQPLPLARTSTVQERPSSLPAWPTSLVGRHIELAAIELLLKEEGLRLLTLTGPGGTGKTRLGIEAAGRSIGRFKDGVYFVPLAAVSDANVVCSEIAQTLGLKESAAVSLRTMLADYLSDKQMLLVLDNFEQVLESASDIAALIAAAPQLKIMVTSRALLHIRGEQEFLVPPLALVDLASLPTSEVLMNYSAVALFVERAQMAKHDFQLTEENSRAVAEICASLDGLPLALELAAARIKLLGPQDLLARLSNRLNVLTSGPRDLPERQQTIRETIRWSYDLLSDEEKKLFRWLSVFVGGFKLADAEMFCAALGNLQLEPLEGIASLLDKSLLIRKGDGESRFGMLETIRDFGLEHLESCGEADRVRRCHANYFLQVAEKAEPALVGKEQKLWLDRLEQEHDNLRSILKWTEIVADAETGLRMAGALWRFWLMHGHFTEGRERLTRALQADQTVAAREARAKALNGLGTLTQNQGDYEKARILFEESLAIWRKLGQEHGIATSLINLGWIAFHQCDYEAARALSEEGLSLHLAVANKQGIVLALNNLGNVAHYQGNFQRARDVYNQSIELRRELNDKRGLAFSLTHLTRTLIKLGEYSQAAKAIEEAVVLIEPIGDKQGLGYALAVRGELLTEQGLWQEAIPMIERGIAFWRAMGDRFGLNMGLSILARAVLESGEDQRVEVICSDGLKLQKELRNQRDVAVWLQLLAEVALKQGNWLRATKCFAGATALLDRIASQVSPQESEKQQRNLSIVRSQLGDEAFRAVFASGQEITMEQWLRDATRICPL